MLLRCRKLMDGPGPSESVIEIDIDGGTEEVIVHNNSLKGGAIEVGSVIGQKDNFSLVELPRESASGRWRVWVPNSAIKQTA